MGDLGFGKPIFWVGLAAGIVAGALGYRCVQKRCAAKKAAAAALPQASLEELLQQKAEIEALIEAQQSRFRPTSPGAYGCTARCSSAAPRWRRSF